MRKRSQRKNKGSGSFKFFPRWSDLLGNFSAPARLTPRRLQFETLEGRTLLSAGPATFGSEFQVNTYTTGNQGSPRVAADAAGDFVTVWESDQNGGTDNVYGQLYNSAGVAQGSEFRVNNDTLGDYGAPSVAMDTAGDFVVAWTTYFDGDGYGVYAQLYNSAGVAQGSEFLVNTYTTGNQELPSVAMDSAGDFVIAWQSRGQDGSRFGIYAQRYNSLGATQGSEISLYALPEDNQTSPSVAMDSAGDFVIAWSISYADGDNSNAIYAERYNASGVLQGSQFEVNTYTANAQTFPSVAMDSAGDLLVAWQSYDQDGSGYGIYAQQYASTGSAQGSEFQVNTYTTNNQFYPAVTVDSEGDYLVAWQSYYEDDSGYGIYASTGSAQGSEFQVNTYTTASQSAPAAAADSQGDFVVAWQSYGEDGSDFGVYAQRYTTPTPPMKFAVSALPTSLSAGQTTSLTITAEDQFSNVITNFSDSVTLSDSLGFANFTPASFSNGVATVTATLSAGGSQTITAIDPMAGMIGTSGPISVTPVVAATATDNSPILNIELGTGAQVGIVSLGSSYQLTLASGDWSVPTGDANISGNGTPVLTISTDGVSAFLNGGINIDDFGSAGGDALSFNNSSSNVYFDSFNIYLTSATQAGALTFNGTTLLSGTASFSASVSGGIAVSPQATLEGTTGAITLDTAGTLSVSSGADVTTQGAITVAAAQVNIATGTNPGVVGAAIAPPAFTTTPIATLTSSGVTLGNANVLAYDPVGDYGLYEASYSGDTVSEFAPGATTPTMILTSSNGIQSPGALLFDASGDLFVGNASGGVIEFAPGGTTPIATFDTPSGLQNIFSLAMDSSGHLFAADPVNNVIAEFDPASGTDPIAAITDGLDAPMAMVFDSSGNLYVANSDNGGGNGTVTEYQAGSTTAFATLTGFKFGSYNYDHGPLAFDASGNLYVADFDNDLVDIFAPGATTASGVLTGFSGPEALTFDPHGDYGLFVASYGNATVSAFAPGATIANTTVDSLTSPESLVFDPLGDLFIAGTAYNYYYTPYGAIDEFSPTPTKAVPQATSVTIESFDSTNPIQIGTTTNPPGSGVYLTNGELGQIYTISAGTFTIGDAQQTGNITFTDAAPAQAAGDTLNVVQDTTGAGQVILSDNAQAGPALSNSGPINITAGTGGIVSLDQNDGTADIATTGQNVTLLTNGPVGSPNDRIQLADRSSAGDKSVVTVGSMSLEPSSVYLAGVKGASSNTPTLALGGVLVDSQGSTNPPNAIDITAAGNLLVTSNATIEDVGGGNLLLGADLTEGEQGNHGPGSLTIQSGAAVTTTGQITLRGTNVVISTPENPIPTGGVVEYGPTASAVINTDRYPDAIVFNTAGDMFVGLTNGNVLEFAPGQTTAMAVFSDPSLQSAGALAIDGSGDLFVANSAITIYGGLMYYGGTNVVEFKPGSGITTAVAVLTDSSINDPTALAFDSSGDLFVTSYRSNKVTEFAPGQTTAMAVLSDPSLKGPVGLAFDSSGNLFVVDGKSDQVTEFGPGQTTAKAVLSSGAFGRFPPVATAIAVDSQDDVFIANFTFGNTDDVTEFAAGSTVATAELGGVSTPSALAFDSFGNLYVSQQGDNPPLGTLVGEFVPGATTPSLIITDPSIQNPTALAFDTSGDLFIGTFGNSVVTEFVPTGLASSGNGGALIGAPTAGGTGPMASNVTIQSSDEANAIQVGTTTSALGTGIYLTNNELAQISVAATGTLTFGDPLQTGNITFTTVTPTNNSGTKVDVVESATSSAAIVLDTDQGAGTALNGNGGMVSLTPGRGGVKASLYSTASVPLVTNGFSVTPGSSISLALDFAPTIGEQITLINNTATPAGSNTISGAFGNLPQDGSVTLTYMSKQYTLDANYDGGNGNDLVFTAAAAAASKLVVSAVPSTLTAGATTTLTITAEDASGNVVSTFSDTVTLSDSLSKATFGAVSFSDGVATVTATLDTAGTQTITASDTTSSSIQGTSNAVTISAAAATQLLLVSQPPSPMTWGDTFGLTVIAEDAYGNLATSFAGNVSVAIQTNPGASTLSGSTMATASGGQATFAGLSLSNAATGYTLAVSSTGLTGASTDEFDIGPATLTIHGQSGDNLEVTFQDSSDFSVDLNGVTTAYIVNNVDKVIYDGPSGQYTMVTFYDPVATDAYAATQSLSSTTLLRAGTVNFEFDANNVANLYQYVADPDSTATISLTAGSGANFYVDAAQSGYSYLADPAAQIYNELSGFAQQTVSASGTTTYAYIDSTSGATVNADPAGSSINVGGFVSTLTGFPELYVVGATDGTDKITLNSEGGALVVTPTFTSVQGTFNSASFTIGALYAAQVTAQASAGGGDSAYVYSFAHDTFAGTVSTSTLTGSATNLSDASFDFSITLQGYPSIAVLESGTGTDVVNLSSPGNGTFISGPMASTLAFNGVTAFTIDTFIVSNQIFTPVASQINFTDNEDLSDVAYLYDGPGTNSLVAAANIATLTRNLGTNNAEQTLAMIGVGLVCGVETQGNNDTVQRAAFDFAFRTFGNWVSK